ncbi:MAG: hypothetical protein R3B67_11605 [Phycisphaerales bacterium]
MPPPHTHNPNTHAPSRPHWLALGCCAAMASGIACLVMLPQSSQNRYEWLPMSWQPEEPASDQPSDDPAGSSQEAPQDEPESDVMRECVITLRTGRTIKGELIREDSRIVVIGIEGIETTFQRRNVTTIVVLPPVEERYKDLRATISDTDIDSRLALVEWLRARRAYSLALDELDSILAVDPTNPHAKLLHTWLSEYGKLSKSDKAVESEPDQDRDEGDDREYKIQQNELPTLSDEQINLMRVYEIDLRDPPKIIVPDEVMLELMRMHPDRFSPDEDQRKKTLSIPEVEKLKLIFALRARELYSRIQVLENPDSMQRFKDQVHTGRGWLINACASTRCHGGVDAGSFRLINRKPNTDETAFTNLYIIENTKLANGQPLIDFENPDRSALLQMGMVQSNALIPHPELPRGYPGRGYSPIFRNTRERKYQQAVDWIRSMYQPRPEFDFEYPPAEPQTQPEPDQNDAETP